MREFKNLIFDFDGTISDVLEITPALFELVWKDMGRTPPSKETMMSYRGLGPIEIAKREKLPLRKVPMGLQSTVKHLSMLRQKVPVVKGMDVLLRDLKKSGKYDSMHILTSNKTENVEFFLRKYQIEDLFDSITGDLTAFNKPKKLKQLMTKNELKPIECLMIGDENRDLIAANRCGISAIAVEWGLGIKARYKKHKPMRVVANVAELREVLL
jgi:phosphoglycolate phosphatase